VGVFKSLARQKISVGLLLDSFEIPAWQYHLIEQLLASPYASIKVVILSDPESVGKRATEPCPFLYRIFERHDKRQRRTTADACVHADVSGLLKGVDSIGLPPDGSELGPLTLRDIGAYKLEAIVALGRLQAVDVLCRLAKYGVWFLSDDAGQLSSERGPSIGFWEVVGRRAHVRSALIIRQAGAGMDMVAYESYSGIHHTSHARTRDEHLWKVLFFVPRVLRRFHEDGMQFLHGLAAGSRHTALKESTGKKRLTNGKLLLPLMSYLFWRLQLKLRRKLYIERWILMFSLAGRSSQPAQFSKLLPSKERFWADPHIVRRNGDFYIFLEDASAASGRGHISVMHMNVNGGHSQPKVVLERPYHLSYPFILGWGSELFLIPESAENGTVELYRCKVFPYEWEFKHNLMENVAAYDATLFEHNGLWWMFANIKAHPSASSWDELCLFYANIPTSKHWRSHPMNPIVSDVRLARPAGKIFVEDGQLYRPSQNSSYWYGYGLNINKILELTTTTYREEVSRTLEPKWDRSIRGVHTFNRVDDFVVLDAIYRWRPGR